MFDRGSMEERRNVDLSGINVIEMPVRLTLDSMSIGYNISSPGLRIPLGVGILVIRVIKVTMGSE